MCQQRKEVKKDHHPLLDVVGNKAATNEEKVQVLNAFFALVFNNKTKVPSPLNWKTETGSRMKPL